MTVQRQAGFWIAALVVLLLVLWLLQSILLPFIAGFVLAYFLDPVADRLEKLGLPRVVATALILVGAIAFIILAIVGVAPVLADQAVKLAADLPGLGKALVARLNDATPASLKELLGRFGGDGNTAVGDLASKASGWLATVLQSVWSGGLALVNVLSLLIVTPIVAFYLLLDWDHIVAKVDSWVPRDHVEEVRGIARDIDRTMAGFIRGQGTVCLALGIFYAVGLSLAGLKFGLAIGMGAGLLSFIPYIGAITGGLLAIGVALVQFLPNSDYGSIMIVVGVFAAGQFLEGNVLSPKLVGGSIGLHPVWLMFALFAFGYLFGFAGLLIAVPLAAATGVLMRYVLKRYLGSNVYRGVPAQVAPDSKPLPKPRRKG
jgi:predicted PurR-regulated permease PerM